MDIQEKIKLLEQEREKQTTRLFALMIEIAFVFGIPAAAVSIVSVQMNHKEWLYVLLPITFITSWIIVIIRYNKMEKKLSALDKEIRELKKQS